MRGRIAGVALVVAGCALAGAMCGCSASAAKGVTGPAAGVLDTQGRVILVDLDRGSVVETVRLESRAFDIAADPATGTFVTAQSGGVSDEADDRIGIVDARDGGSVTYVKLQRPNPTGVEVVGPGRVLVDHGWIDRKGVFVSLVDTSKMRTIETSRLAGNNQPLFAYGGAAWSTGVDDVTGAPSLMKVDVRTLEATTVLQPGHVPLVMAGSGDSMWGWLSDGPKTASIVRYDARTGRIADTAFVELDDGGGSMAFVADTLVAADYTGIDPENPGRKLWVFDPQTLELERTIPVPGGICDLSAWGDTAVAYDQTSGSLLVVDPVAGRIVERIGLPGMAGLPAYVAVLE